MVERAPELSAVWGVKWLEVPEESACARSIIGHAATYLAEDHQIAEGRRNSGSGYGPKTAEGILNGLLQATRKRFEKSKVEATKVRTHAASDAARSLRCRTHCTALQALHASATLELHVPRAT